MIRSRPSTPEEIEARKDWLRAKAEATREARRKNLDDIARHRAAQDADMLKRWAGRKMP